MKRITGLFLALTFLMGSLLVFPTTTEAISYTPATSINWNGHTYEVYDRNITWEYAKEYCEEKGGHLATITSPEEQAVVESISKSKKVFLCEEIYKGKRKTSPR